MTSRTSFFICFASASVEICITLPSFSFTVGPSIVSQGVNAAPFPGRSTFSCVPVAMQLFSTCMVAGCTHCAEKPDVLARP